MKKLFFFLLSAVILAVAAGCGGDTGAKIIKIAVIGETADLYSGYQDGTRAAAEDLAREYADSGFEIEYEFYDYDGSYEEGAAIVDMLAADESVTAVVGPVDMDLNKTAAHIFDGAGKIFVVPFFLYDSVYRDNHYDMVFSMCNSGEKAGMILRRAASYVAPGRWAVCSAEREFERSELQGFLTGAADDGISVVDCVDITEVAERFDDTYARWEALDVTGVVMFAINTEGFEILKKIKGRNPDIVCAGDTAFDNSSLLTSGSELVTAMEGFIMADEFILDIETDEETERYEQMAENYSRDNDSAEIDLWYVQGYNAVRMIADTAVASRASDPSAIAAALHEDGYRGTLQNFEFEENGELAGDELTFAIFDEQGYTLPYRLTEE